MKNMRKNQLYNCIFSVNTAFIIITVFLFFTATAEIIGQEKETVKEQEKEPWRIGYSVFSSYNLNKETQYLTYSIPRLLRNNLSSCSAHTLTEAEKKALSMQKYKKQLDKLQVELTQLRVQQSELLFKEEVAEKTRQDLIEKIKDKEKEINQLSYTDMDFGASKRPIAFPEKDNTKGLIELPIVYEEQRKNFEYIVEGAIEAIQNYLYIRIKIYSTIEEKPVFTFRDAVRGEEVEKIVPTVVSDMAETFLGNKWGTLRVETKPADEGIVFVNGKMYGRGTTEIPYLIQGTYSIEIISENYKDITDTVQVKAGETSVFETELQSLNLDTVRIESVPETADVYVGSVWQGSTPLVITRPETAKELTVIKEGYEPGRIKLTPEGEKLFTVSLERQVLNRADVIEKERNEFYFAFGFFGLSVGTSVLLKGLESNSRMAVEQTLNPEIERKRQILQYCFLGSIAIDGTLLVKSLLDLFDYIEVSDISGKE